MLRPSREGTAVTSPNAFRAELQRLRADRHARPDDPPGHSDAPGHPDSLDSPYPLELGPASVYEAVTRQMVESLTGDIRDIKGRLNTLFFMLIGGIMLEIAIRIISP